MLGKIIVNNEDVDFRNINKENLVAKVSTKEVTTYNPNGELHIVAVDCGMKANIVRCLVERGAKVTVVPYVCSFLSLEHQHSNTNPRTLLNTGTIMTSETWNMMVSS